METEVMEAQVECDTQQVEQRKSSNPPVVIGRDGRVMNPALLAHCWKPGQSGNPNPQKAPVRLPELAKLAKAHTAEAVEQLVKWMRCSDGKIAVVACIALLDRGWGRPRESKENVETLVSGWDTMTMPERIAVLRGQRKKGPGQEAGATTADAPKQSQQDG